ncbi:MAG: LD-carboxypeptidase [Candidatus Aenigmatarchaeota archaeon]
MTLIKPKRLNIGDTIGIISPSSSLPADIPFRFRRGVECLEKLGFRVKIGKYAVSKYGYMAGKPIERAMDINSMFKDANVKAIISSIGGYNSNQLLNLLKYKMIRKNPKIFMGYSDATSLLLTIFKKTN